ncbi:unnamed protein product [Toxocara canis]|uniref:Transposase n=1 Tax=Toxocara canis TaxID=6265 RepID=A0A183UUJ5_TOXCA|nr:unnamed protein product [Toxocara canis]
MTCGFRMLTERSNKRSRIDYEQIEASDPWDLDQLLDPDQISPQKIARGKQQRNVSSEIIQILAEHQN